MLEENITLPFIIDFCNFLSIHLGENIYMEKFKLHWLIFDVLPYFLYLNTIFQQKLKNIFSSLSGKSTSLII